MARSQMRRAGALLLLVGALLAASASSARADGDPASDYLVNNQVFLTSLTARLSAADRQLVATVRSANRAGFAIRVALVPTDYDLGSITALWRKPRIYAEFLGAELSAAYRQRLLVVMPNGFGFNWPRHSAAPAYQVLAGVPVAAGTADPAAAAVGAVRRLAAASGVTIKESSQSSSGGGSTHLGVILAAAAVAVVVLGAAALAIRQTRRRRERPRFRVRTVSRPHFSVSLRWAIPGVAVLAVAAVLTTILALRRSPQSVSAASLVTPPPFSWAADRRPAPDFVLHDQNGRPVSITAYRGQPVIVTFIDPLCRNLCPLEAQVLNQMERQLPPAQRPAILAVSVDRWADTRADLLQTVREWHLVPQWRWAVGAPAQLAAVWRRYEVGVQVTTKHIAGTTINYITHTEAAYVVDASGHERALFFWPFWPQDVRRVLRQVA
jgi:cytochrome oxidase Cu insertion factor (SCO1/SenC/PrrC family)